MTIEAFDLWPQKSPSSRPVDSPDSVSRPPRRSNFSVAPSPKRSDVVKSGLHANAQQKRRRANALSELAELEAILGEK